ncbi:pyridoxamine 5'-phosphate oxidase [Legionella rubrilucens]|uniref:Pyridoxine/pyridoxamine 5'-phosphate oxidase n=1 Tax=Legionella rubrilucens TaxID=458 RepID=A0A0W0XQB4_9GAMM|nr:pyridoxamine 5'-phosphate oxidase [Legionella rubrilucens]KTD46776.1 pyridoxamine 5'-phosphate oxidase [Legionella rubrilucens]
MTGWRTLADIRRDYGDLRIDDQQIGGDPLLLFQRWFNEVLASEKQDPTAMVLSTVDDEGMPDSRVVLLKGIEEGCFIFYTNYESAKAVQLHNHPFAALNFYWPEMARQVRIRGGVEKTSREMSDAYFASRPPASQLSALASPQSRPIATRQELEMAFNRLMAQWNQQPIVRPENWGGYQLKPSTIEFWQGRDNRLHDRVLYRRQGEEWIGCRLAP